MVNSEWNPSPPFPLPSEGRGRLRYTQHVSGQLPAYSNVFQLIPAYFFLRDTNCTNEGEFSTAEPQSTPHPGPMTSQVRHEMDAPSTKIALRTVVPSEGRGESCHAPQPSTMN